MGWDRDRYRRGVLEGLLILCERSSRQKRRGSLRCCGSRVLYRIVSFFFSSRRRHTRFDCDWSSDVCSSDLPCALQKLTILLPGPCWRNALTENRRAVVEGIREQPGGGRMRCSISILAILIADRKSVV